MRDWLNMWRTTLIHLWRHRRRMLARFHKDKRQRIAALVCLGIAVYIVFYAIYFVRNPAAAFVMLLATGAAAWIRRRHRSDDDSFPTLMAAPAAPVPSTDRQYSIEDDGRYVLAAWLLYVRALSELAIRHKAKNLPAEVVTRSFVLARMREFGIVESLPPDELNLHYLPDGSWPEAATFASVARGSEVEALLWAAGKVRSLTPIEDLDRVKTIDLPGPGELCAPDTLSWRERNDIRTESYAAYGVWLRTFAEMRHRGFDDPLLQDAELVRASACTTTNSGDEGSDFVLGTTLITKCDDGPLRIAFEQLGMRVAALRYLLREDDIHAESEL